jgi:hypothetical protein
MDGCKAIVMKIMQIREVCGIKGSKRVHVPADLGRFVNYINVSEVGRKRSRQGKDTTIRAGVRPTSS